MEVGLLKKRHSETRSHPVEVPSPQLQLQQLHKQFKIIPLANWTPGNKARSSSSWSFSIIVWFYLNAAYLPLDYILRPITSTGQWLPQNGYTWYIRIYQQYTIERLELDTYMDSMEALHARIIRRLWAEDARWHCFNMCSFIFPKIRNTTKVHCHWQIECSVQRSTRHCAEAARVELGVQAKTKSSLRI